MGAPEDVDLRLGVIGSAAAQSLVRSFTGPEKPGSPRHPDTGGIKKEIMVDGRRYFLLLRRDPASDQESDAARTRQVTKLIASSSLDFRFRR